MIVPRENQNGMEINKVLQLGKFPKREDRRKLTVNCNQQLAEVTGYRKIGAEPVSKGPFLHGKDPFWEFLDMVLQDSCPLFTEEDWVLCTSRRPFKDYTFTI